MIYADVYDILKIYFPNLSQVALDEWATAVVAGQYTMEAMVTTDLEAGEIPARNPEFDWSDEGHPQEDVGPDAGVSWEDPAYIVPPDFEQAITHSDSWLERILDWGLSDDQQDFLLRFMHDRFVNGFGPDEDNPTGWTPGLPIGAFIGEDGDPTTEVIYDSVQSFFDSDMVLPPGAVGSDYIPGQGALPEGWLTFWGEDYKDPEGVAVIDNWLDSWVERFNKNAKATGGPGDPKYDEKDLISDFYNHAEDGLYAQTWWTDRTNNFLAMTEMWYTQGGPGGAQGLDAPPPGWDTPEFMQGDHWSTYTGTGNWGKIWSDSIEIIRATAEDLGIEDELTDTMVSQIAFRLMAQGGAAAHLEPQTAEGWPNQARQMVENILIENIRLGTFQQELGVGNITDIEKRLRAYADSQMIDLDALAVMNDTTVRDWALNIQSETGLNESQVFSTIANQAHTQWGLTSDQIGDMGQAGAEGSSTITNFIAPLWKAATDLWEDSSYTKDDQWLMDNYQEVAEDGTKRFRTGQEMRNLARTNLDRFQHSSQYQDPLNQFLTRAAAMFRSDY